MNVTAISILWGLLAGLSIASNYLFDKWILGRYNPATICAFLLPLGALFLTPLVTFSPKSPLVWSLLLLLVFLSTYLGNFLYYTGLKSVEASRAVLVTNIEPVIAVTLAVVMFGERFNQLGLLGAGLIIFAALLVSLPESGLRVAVARFALRARVQS